MRPDPIGLAGGINLFVYSNENPINYVDPHGLFWSEYFDLFGSATQLAVHGFIQTGNEASGLVLYSGEVFEAAFYQTLSIIENNEADFPTIFEFMLPIAGVLWYENNEFIMWGEELFTRSIEETIAGWRNCDVSNDMSNEQQKLRKSFNDKSNEMRSLLTDVISGNRMEGSVIRRARYINSDFGTINRTIITDTLGDVNHNWVKLYKAFLKKVFSN